MMNKLIISVVLSTSLLMAMPSFSIPVSGLDNPVLRSDAASAVNTVPKAGASYAYWHRWHHWHRWHRHHWHHWRHW